MMRPGIVRVFLGAAVLAALAGCKFKVNKSSDGERADVKIATPFGGISVNKNQPSAAEIGLPVYPGSTIVNEKDSDQSANVDMGFGSWKLRVRVAHYDTPDSRDQVLAFYRKALSEYGDVIECAGNNAVGTPVKTLQGLGCEDSGNGHANQGRGAGHANSGELELKAGSPRHQHLVSFKNEGGSGTRYALIALDLPHNASPGHEGAN